MFKMKLAELLVFQFMCLLPAGPAGPAGLAQESGVAVGTLRVKSDVAEVLVILDDREVGHTPLTLRSVATGRHEVLLVKEGYEDHAEQVEVPAAKTVSTFVVMKPEKVELPELPIGFKAIHQHRFGYCAGTLTVTAEALDFEDEKGEDRFHLPIRSLGSVSRSWGPVPGMAPSGINTSTDLMAMRVEAPGRSYGFLAYRGDLGAPMSVASEETKRLFRVVYALWTAGVGK